MNIDSSFLTVGEDILDWIFGIIETIFDLFVSAGEAVYTLFTTLCEYNEKIIELVDDPAAGTGLPVVDAIGVVRYLVGDVVFYFIYILILLGCLSTLYRLVCLLIEAYLASEEHANYKGNNRSSIAILTKLFRK